MLSIYKRELKTYINGMTGAIFVSFLLLIIGIYTTALNLNGGYPTFELVPSGILMIYLLIIPIITMRSFAEDRHTRTDQLLFSLPLKLSQVVMAKYLAMVTVLAVPSLIICLYPLILSLYGTVNFTSAYGAILAFFLLGCALISIGMFLSSLTESQVIAAVLTFGAFILIYMMSAISTLIPVTAAASLIAYGICAILIGLILYSLTKNLTVSVSVAGVLILGLLVAYLINASAFEGSIQSMLTGIALFDRYTNFSNGIFDVTAIVYYLSVAGLFVFFTTQSMEKRRWA